MKSNLLKQSKLNILIDWVWTKKERNNAWVLGEANTRNDLSTDTRKPTGRAGFQGR